MIELFGFDIVVKDADNADDDIMHGYDFVISDIENKKRR